MVGETRCSWGGRLHGFSPLPGSGPASSKTRGPLVQIPGRITACPSCRPAYGPLIMLDPKPGRTPAKPAPPTLRETVTGHLAKKHLYSNEVISPRMICLPENVVHRKGAARTMSGMKQASMHVASLTFGRAEPSARTAN